MNFWREVGIEAQKERELLADERGAKLLSQPRLMANVLTKIGKALQSFPKENLATRLSTNLFLVSPLARRPQILAAHPQIVHRVHNITRLASKPKRKTIRIITVALLSFVLILSASVASYSVMQFQTSYFQNDTAYRGLVASSVRPMNGSENSNFLLAGTISPQDVEIAPLPLQTCPELPAVDKLFISKELVMVQIKPENSQMIAQSSQEIISGNTFIRLYRSPY